MPRGKRRTGAARRGRPSALARLSTADLRHELERRRGSLQELIRQRDALSAELQELESAFGGSMASTNGRRPVGRPRGSGGRRRGRPPGSGSGGGKGRRGPRGRNATNLVDALRGVLAGTTQSVREVADAVQKAGYRTKSANFRTIVNQALLANSKLFRKVARGQYTVR